jgi:Ca2+-binding EF-hand superfamily protein
MLPNSVVLRVMGLTLVVLFVALPTALLKANTSTPLYSNLAARFGADVVSRVWSSVVGRGDASSQTAAVVTTVGGASVDFDVNTDGLQNGLDLREMANAVQSQTPYGVTTATLDLTKDKRIGIEDWQTILYRYLVKPTLRRYVYDVNNDGVIQGADLDEIVRALQLGVTNTWRYTARVDFDSDGVNSIKDWARVVGYFNDSYKRPAYLYDVTNDGVFNGKDLQSIADSLQKGMQGSAYYSIRVDFDADGVNSAKDWAKVIGYVEGVLKAPTLLYDETLDGVITNSDLSTFSVLISAGISNASRYSIRADFNADGVNSIKDWARVYDVVALGTAAATQTWIDVDANGLVNSADIDLVKRFAGNFSRYDVNADGVVNALDVTYLAQF